MSLCGHHTLMSVFCSLPTACWEKAPGPAKRRATPGLLPRAVVPSPSFCFPTGRQESHCTNSQSPALERPPGAG